MLDVRSLLDSFFSHMETHFFVFHIQDMSGKARSRGQE